MAEIKVSIMEDANGISDDDLLYIVKKTGDSEYESRKTTVREFKSGMEEEIIDKMMETIGGSDDIQYSYRNGWLDWNNAFNISLTSNTQTFTLPMDAHVTSQDTRVNQVKLVTDNNDVSNTTLYALMGNRLEQPSGWYLPAGTTITGVNGTLLIIPMLNAKVDTENSNIILMGEQMTWLDFSNRIEEWGRQGYLMDATTNTNTGESARYGVYIANRASSNISTSTQWVNNINSEAELANNKWTHISEFANQDGTWKTNASNIVPYYFGIYCPFKLKIDTTNQPRFMMRVTWPKESSSYANVWKYTPSAFGTGTYAGKYLSKISSVNPTTTNRIWDSSTHTWKDITTRRSRFLTEIPEIKVTLLDLYPPTT